MIYTIHTYVSNDSLTLTIQNFSYTILYISYDTYRTILTTMNIVRDTRFHIISDLKYYDNSWTLTIQNFLYTIRYTSYDTYHVSYDTNNYEYN